MLREIEVSAAVVGQVTFQEGEDSCGTAPLNLPVSKSDTQALGKKRTHVCACPSPLCPVRAARQLVEAAKATWACGETKDTIPVEAFPLVPDFFGEHVSKQAITAAFVGMPYGRTK